MNQSSPRKKPSYAERMKRKRFHADMYEKCLARFLIARKMILLGEVQQAKEYLNSIDKNVLDYAGHIRRREYEEDNRGLKFLVRYVFLEVDSLTSKPTAGERWEMDKKYYLNQMAKYGW